MATPINIIEQKALDQFKKYVKDAGLPGTWQEELQRIWMNRVYPGDLKDIQGVLERLYTKWRSGKAIGDLP